MRIRWWLVLVVLAVLFLVVLRAQPSLPDNDGTWQRVQETGVLRVGMDASYPPFSDTPNGTPIGLDVDLISEIARRLHVRIEISNMGFDGLYDALITGQVDVLISALSFDPTHLDRVMYTRAYVNAGQLIVSSSGHYEHMEDLDGHTVAVEYGSAGDETARIWQRRLHILNIAHFTTADEALAVVVAGKADAALVDYVTARLYLRSHHGTGLALSPNYVTGEAYAIAVRLRSYDLGGAINDVLDVLDKDGTLVAIIDRWL